MCLLARPVYQSLTWLCSQSAATGISSGNSTGQVSDPYHRSCGRWYHIQCAGLLPDDPPVINPDVQFICATCVENRRVLLARRHVLRADIQISERPKTTRHLYPLSICGHGGCQRDIVPDDEYVVERIVGRRKLRSEGGTGIRTEEFLVKWEGEHFQHRLYTYD